METSATKPYFILIGLFIVTSLALALTVNVNISDEAGITMALPDRVGHWEGQEIRYCQSPTCGQEFSLRDLQDRNVCPSCKGPLDSMSPSEKALLPPDTIILKKKYTGPAGQTLFVAIVMSGRERASIHRPQVCLVGQGMEIVQSRVLEVPLAHRPPLKVMVLDLLRRVQMADQRMVDFPAYYAYWFVGKGRETPYHIQRMIWMASDRILHNTSHRWAYISVMGARRPDSEEYRDQIQEFVQGLYPQMMSTPTG